MYKTRPAVGFKKMASNTLITNQGRLTNPSHIFSNPSHIFQIQIEGKRSAMKSGLELLDINNLTMTEPATVLNLLLCRSMVR